MPTLGTRVDFILLTSLPIFFLNFCKGPRLATKTYIFFLVTDTYWRSLMKYDFLVYSCYESLIFLILPTNIDYDSFFRDINVKSFRRYELVGIAHGLTSKAPFLVLGFSQQA